jgi:hypothetical protein
MAEHADKSDVAHLEHRAGSLGDDRIQPVLHEHRENDDREEILVVRQLHWHAFRDRNRFHGRYWRYAMDVFCWGVLNLGGS